jgi:hypothetical protein
MAGIFFLYRYYRQRRPRLRSKESVNLIENDETSTDIDNIVLSHRNAGHVYTPGIFHRISYCRLKLTFIRAVSTPTGVPYDSPNTHLIPTFQPQQPSKRELIAANVRGHNLRGTFQASPLPQTSESRTETAGSSSSGLDGGYSLLLPPSYSR